MKIIRNIFKYARIVLPASVSLFTFPASISAAQNSHSVIQAEGAFVSHSCGYYSATDGKVAISYWSPVLSKSSKVYLHYGFEFPGPRNNGSANVDWQQIDELTLTPSIDSTDRMWHGQIEKQIHFRSSSQPFLTGLDFVIRIENPGGEVFYDRGNDSENGFYKITWKQSEIHCGNDFPEMRELEITNVMR